MTTIPTPIYQEFTKESLSTLVPTGMVDDKLVTKVNSLVQDDDLKDHFKDNLVSFASILAKGQFTPDQYVSAVTYVTHRLMNTTKSKSWQLTFPHRYAELLSKGKSAKDVSAHVSAYDKTKLVTLITEQTLVQSYIVNSPYHQEMIEFGVKVVRDDKQYMKDRLVAMESVLRYTQAPESIISNKEEISDKSIDIIQQLANATNQLAKAHSVAIENGASPKQIIQEAVYVEVVDD